MDLKNYLIATGVKKADFARAINISAALLHQWIEQIRPVAIRHCPAIEKQTGGQVARKDLRPDDWHKIWPELAEGDPGHAGRQPPSPTNILDTIPLHSVVGIDPRGSS
ncbi:MULTISPECIES: YdaS family helix-turn-helix protein [unclassified Janthinobacterium]|uniref:transcriptional regulator n=1 Tax=unclassified Janthinobacterium TaxID=2610881 RepID=UPI0016175A9A|nr:MULTISPECIES: YdaS family helix-turn-helix protein [unclassified Janthinobacterium]MBB5610396.1 DNA-binding transcriptional regulator YdaS (Cro superfamily) [Janthinobacterium sp. S3T4]MBB5615767.1 DNA-binding transcriptional regulator YdaS (Cro superfamily) [Janthinobacterium sp. S3M3]